MISAALQQAIDSLIISDVYLCSHHTQVAEGINPKYSHDRLTEIQTKHFVKDAVVVQANSHQMLRVFVELGHRWVEKINDHEEPTMLVEIEAVFVAEYEITKDLSKECIDAFSLQNASYHVWPYWREFVTNECSRMRLPLITIPAVQLNHHRSLQLETPIQSVDSE